MKKTTIILSLLILLPLVTLADNPFKIHRKDIRRVEAGGSLGVTPSYMRYNNSFAHFANDHAALYPFNYMSLDDMPFVHLSTFVHYQLSDRIALGLTFGYSTVSGRTYEQYKFAIPDADVAPWPYRGRPFAKATGESYHAMARAKYSWLYNPAIRLYISAALGTECFLYKMDVATQERETLHYTKTLWQLAYQLNPIGIEFGRGNCKPFIELGFGCEGILRAGLVIQIGKRINQPKDD